MKNKKLTIIRYLLIIAGLICLGTLSQQYLQVPNVNETVIDYKAN